MGKAQHRRRKRNAEAENQAAATADTETGEEGSSSVLQNKSESLSSSLDKDEGEPSKQLKKLEKKKRKEQSSVSSVSSFHSVNPPLSKGVLEYIDAQSFHTMTPVQEATIPLLLSNKDVAVQAVTGSGKTLAFLVPIVERILRRNNYSKGDTPFAKNQIGAMIISPTRELAMQTHKVCTDLCLSTKLVPPLLLVGGGTGSSKTNHRPVLHDLKRFQKEGNSIVIGTPGRVEDVITRYSVMDLSELDVLILDEADVLLYGRSTNSSGGSTMMDPTIASILNRLPKMRRTGIFSATTTFSTSTSIKPMLQRAGLRNPVMVHVTVAAATRGKSSSENNCTNDNMDEDDRTSSSTSKEQKTKETPTATPSSTSYTPSSLTNYYFTTTIQDKLSHLVSFIKSHPDEKMIVFFLTCACVEFFGTALQQILSPDAIEYDHKTKKNTKKTDASSSTARIHIELLHGKMVQKRRENAMERFRQSTSKADGSSSSSSSCTSVLFCTDVAARGLDVTDVDWVIQVDAPQDPSTFVHRVGRSARAGREGSSLVFLTEKEESYVDLLANRKVYLKPLPQRQEEELLRMAIEEKTTDMNGKLTTKEKEEENDFSASSNAIIIANQNDNSILANIRSLVLKDRDLLEKGTKAFTSYIRAYKEHVCAFIFRFASLDLGHLATAFCLLRLPKMPELREYHTNNNKNNEKNHGNKKKKNDSTTMNKEKVLKHFIPAGPEVDIHAIPFLDVTREAARQKRLAAELAAGGKNAKQIKAEQKKAAILQRQKERRQVEIDKGRNPNKKKNKRGRHAQLLDEWDELAKEERLYKKFRRGKITKERYEELLHQVGADDDGGGRGDKKVMNNKKATGSISDSCSSSEDDDDESI